MNRRLCHQFTCRVHQIYTHQNPILESRAYWPQSAEEHIFATLKVAIKRTQKVHTLKLTEEHTQVIYYLILLIIY